MKLFLLLERNARKRAAAIAWLVVIGACSTPGALAQNATAASGQSPATSAESTAPGAIGALLQPGMRFEQINHILGRQPDSAETSGACGVLEVLTWQHERLRIIGNNGVVSAIVRIPAE